MNADVLRCCEKIIRLFFSGSEWSPEIVARFQKWLIEESNCPEKDLAMRRIFYEIMDRQPDEKTDTETIERYNCILDKIV